MRLDIHAYVDSAERADALRQAAADPRLRRSRLEVYGGGLDAAVTALGQNPSPQLLVIESPLRGSELVESLDRLADVVAPDTRVVVLGDDNDIALYRRLLSMGVSEYLVGPLEAGEVADTVVRIFSAGDEASGKLIAVHGVRGGVGTTAVSVNLAHALARETEGDVVLVDLDLWYGTAALALNVAPRQSLSEMLAQPGRIDDVLLSRYMVKYDDRLSVLSGAGNPTTVKQHPGPEALDVLWTVLRQTVDYVVVDVPHLWTPWVSDVLLEANELVVVAYPDLANLRDARTLMETVGAARKVNAPTHLLLNREGLTKKGELDRKDFAESLEMAPRAVVPFDGPSFALAMNNGEPLHRAAPTCAAVKVFTDLAWVLSGRERPAPKPKGLPSLRGLLARS